MDVTIEDIVNFREKDLRREGIILAEGRFLTERYLGSGWPVTLVVCASHLEEEIRTFVDAYTAGTGNRCGLHVLPKGTVETLAGFPFHRGVFAVGPRPEPVPLDSFLETNKGATRIVVCPELTDAENLGSILRSAAAFGYDAVLLGNRCTDPLSRRVLRVSMGGVFGIPLLRCAAGHENTAGPGEAAGAARAFTSAGFTIIGAAAPGAAPSFPPETAAPLPLPAFIPPEKTALVLGSEGYGIPADWAGACGSFVTIPIPGAGSIGGAGPRTGAPDSLNVGVAAGILFYHFSRST